MEGIKFNYNAGRYHQCKCYDLSRLGVLLPLSPINLVSFFEYF